MSEEALLARLNNANVPRAPPPRELTEDERLAKVKDDQLNARMVWPQNAESVVKLTLTSRRRRTNASPLPRRSVKKRR